MKPVLLIEQPQKYKIYERHDIISRIKDRFNIKLIEDNYLKDLNLNIKRISFPMNVNIDAYMRNMEIAKSYLKKEYGIVAPKVWRKMDYNVYNKFQKELLAYSIVSSMQLILRLKNKSIRNSCIVIYDPTDYHIYESVLCLSKFAKYIVFLTDNTDKAKVFADYVMANYGISPIITRDKNHAFKNGDFILTSRDGDLITDKPIWTLDNLFSTFNSNNQYINDVTYKVPWLDKDDIPIELLGAILCQMEEKDIERSLKYNGVFLNNIMFNGEVLIFE
ncbi:hypothetical protein [uncultured Clostridium sp.]|uniref:hypothetical protein n=1 Tax=uncultured Clostridium sp. TaxID=59620 RepID=UPI0028EB06DF|nr:hypothetical protein [uncultured Clostridium sp.]